MVKTFFLIKLGVLALYVWPVTRQRYFRQHSRWIVGQIGADKLPAYPLRPFADRGRWDGSSPPAAWVVVARFPYGKVFAYLLLGSLIGTPNYPLFSCGRIVFPLINRVS